MDEGQLARALEALVGPSLSAQLAADFLKIRRDLSTHTLERASVGKFVETFAQSLQHLQSGSHDARPNVDSILRGIENDTALDDGIRVCAARAARLMYTLRNKRNIAHKNSVDPNVFDLTLAHSCAAWIMSELLRHSTGMTMTEAGRLIEMVQTPVGTLVEEIDGHRLVHADVSVTTEILILLHSHYPDRMSEVELLTSMSGRSAGSVKNRLGELRSGKLIVGRGKEGFRLTQAGYEAAVAEIRAVQLANSTRSAA